MRSFKSAEVLDSRNAMQRAVFRERSSEGTSSNLPASVTSGYSPS